MMSVNKKLRIVFMGTPLFAVESLKLLLANDQNIVGVITAPDKPAGRGHKLQISAVKEFASSQGLTILQPSNLKDENFLEELRNLQADLQIVVAFRMLPEVVWNMPPMGTFNLHASLLPQYRGAAPINWAIINGENETGVTTFFLKHEIDTGEIIFQEKISIQPADNAGTMHDKLMVLGAKMVVKTVDAISNNMISSRSQKDFISEDEELKPAPKIFKDTCKIDWNKPVEEIHNFIRGLSPYPAAWSEIEVNGNLLSMKVFESRINNESHSHQPGEIITDNKTILSIAAKNGFIEVLDIQLAGKRRMKITEFLNGFSF